MNDLVEGQPWGMCAAYGCPLAGSMGSGGQWWCFCHHEQPSSANAAITMVLRANGVLCRLSLALRGRDEEAISLCRQELRGHALGGELAFNREKDRNAYGWLLRIERALIEMTAHVGKRQPISSAVQTAPVIGPTHAIQHYTERSDDPRA
jgi:hypothetical protein